MIKNLAFAALVAFAAFTATPAAAQNGQVLQPIAPLPAPGQVREPVLQPSSADQRPTHQRGGTLVCLQSTRLLDWLLRHHDGEGRRVRMRA
jgi:hypothetical protein